jgi:TolA-binding protein
MQSQDDRDAEGFAARREREAVVKEFSKEEVTGRYEGEELDEQRAQRPDVERIGRLEKKQDELKQNVEKKHDELKRDVAEVRSDVKTVSGQVNDLRVGVAGAVGKLEGQEAVLSEMLSIVKKSAEKSVERDHVTFTAKVEVDKAQELAKVEVDKVHDLAEIEVTKEEKVDTVKAKSDRRKRNLTILGFVASGGGIIELLHRFGVL